MIDIIANICCLIYYVIATISTLPHIVRIVKRKSSTDISLTGTILSTISGTCWTIYIFLTQQTILVYIGTIWDFIVMVIYIVVVFKYHKKSNE